MGRGAGWQVTLAASSSQRTLVPPSQAVFPPINKKIEEKVILTLLGELIEHFDVDLNLNPTLERGGEIQATVTQPGRLIIVGTSHMTR